MHHEIKPVQALVDEYPSISKHLFPTDIASCIVGITGQQHAIHPQELELVRTATTRRIAEFTAGRYCAHTLLGTCQQPILIGKDREPLWPDGVIGSITHCKDIAGAAITCMTHYSGIGFDIENIKQLKRPIEKYICTPEESKWLAEHNEYSRTNLTLLIFSLKEAVYKCLFQAYGVKHPLRRINLRINFNDNAASVILLSEIVDFPAGYSITVRFFITEQHIFSSAIHRTDR